MNNTAVFGSDGLEVFPSSAILNSSVSPSNSFAKHVVEDGTTVIDNKIENQIRISMGLILNGGDYKQVYNQIVSASVNSTKLSIQTRVKTFDNMYIESYPHKESAAIFDTVTLNIEFIEQLTSVVITQDLTPSEVNNQADADQVDRGEQLPKDNGTIATSITDWLF